LSSRKAEKLSSKHQRSWRRSGSQGTRAANRRGKGGEGERHSVQPSNGVLIEEKELQTKLHRKGREKARTGRKQMAGNFACLGSAWGSQAAKGGEKIDLSKGGPRNPSRENVT